MALRLKVWPGMAGIEADAKFLMHVVNQQIVFPLVLWNFGMVAKPPVWVIEYEAQRDLSAISQWLGRLWAMRLPISKQYVYETFSIPQPSEGEEVIEMPAETEKPDASSTGVDAAASFAEKKTLKLSERLKKPYQSRTPLF